MKPSKLTTKLLKNIDACEDGIEFLERNNLVNFPVNLISKLTGDHDEFVSWLYSHVLHQNIEVDERDNLIKYNNSYEFKYDENDNIIYSADHDIGAKTYYTYDERGNKIKCVVMFENDIEVTESEYDENNNLVRRVCTKNDIQISEINNEYDDHGNLIHHNGTNSLEYWQKFNDSNLLIRYESKKHTIYYEYDENGNKTREHSNNGGNIFWYYDERGNLTHFKRLNINEHLANVSEYWKEYDENDNLIHFKNLDGHEYWQEFDDRGNVIKYTNDSCSMIYNTEFYPDGQLKRIGDMTIPFFEK